ncbi:MAG: hypothetical protein ACYDHP_04805 [Ferrimicrobium sp.]
MLVIISEPVQQSSRDNSSWQVGYEAKKFLPPTAPLATTPVSVDMFDTVRSLHITSPTGADTLTNRVELPIIVNPEPGASSHTSDMSPSCPLSPLSCPHGVARSVLIP